MPPGLKPGQKALVGAGRKKGTPNKNKSEIQQLIQEVCPGWNSLQAMAHAAMTGAFPIWDHAEGRVAIDQATGLPLMVPISEKTRGTLLKELNEYQYAKRKAVEISDPNGENPLAGGLTVRFVRPQPQDDTPPEG